MDPLIDFSTVVEMFDNITSKFLDSKRPMLMHRINGIYSKISYAEMRNSVNRFTLGLAALGIERGDHIALISENRPEWVIADMAMMKLGAVNVCIYPTLTPKQIEFILKDSCAKHVIVSNQHQLKKILKIGTGLQALQRIVVLSEKAIPHDPRVIAFSQILVAGDEFERLHPDFLNNAVQHVMPDDLLTLIYTSGTTGNPKGVMLTHCNLVSNMKAAAKCIPFTENDVLLSYLPLSHSYERMGGYYTAMSCGATIAYAESIDTIRENLKEVRPTVITTVPRLLERIHNRLLKQVSESSLLRQAIFRWAIGVGKKHAQARREQYHRRVPRTISFQRKLADALVFHKIRQGTGGQIRFFVSGGAALAKELGEFFEAIGILILEGYGMTESSPVIAVNRIDEYRFGTVGKALPGVDVQIADDGEILVRGPNVMQGYWNNLAATREILESNGWLHTGDIGIIDEDGFLKITDRKKHLFVSSGGKNIAPQQLENLFAQSSFIEQFVLIGDGRRYLTALVVPDYDVLKEYATRFGIPYNTVDELSGKPEIYKLLEDELGAIQKDLASYERVRKFTILNTPLSIEGGEITPTLKVRRNIIEEKFKHLIDQMYEGVI